MTDRKADEDELMPGTGGCEPVFVGGLPRSGTTVLHALLCTSEATNVFTPEFHYLALVGHAFTQAKAMFTRSQKAFFSSEEEFVNIHFEYMRHVVDAAWVALGRPRKLILKHPKLTPLFGQMAKHFPTARFVVVIRDARDVVASLIRAEARHQNAKRIGKELVDMQIAQFNGYYGAVIAAATGPLRGRVLGVELERLAGSTLADLREFLSLPDIDTEKLWQRSMFEISRLRHDPFYSAHWGQPLTDKISGTWTQTLDAETAERIFLETLGVRTTFLALTSGQSKSPDAGEAPHQELSIRSG